MRFRDHTTVRGDVFTGDKRTTYTDGGAYHEGPVHTGGGDYVGRDRHDHHSDPFLYGMTVARGFGRVLVGVGTLLYVAGACSFGYVVVSFLLAIFTALQAAGYREPNLAAVPFVPWLPLGVGLALLGVVLNTIGVFISGGRNRRNW